MNRASLSLISVVLLLTGCGEVVETSAAVQPALSASESHRHHLSPHLDAVARLEAANLVGLETVDSSDIRAQGPASSWVRIDRHKIVHKGRSLEADDLERLKQLLLSPESFRWPRPGCGTLSESTFGIRLQCGERVILLHYLPEDRILALTDGFNGDAWALAGESLSEVLDEWRLELGGLSIPK